MRTAMMNISCTDQFTASRSLCDGPITRPEESCRVCVYVCVCVCVCVCVFDVFMTMHH